MIRNWPFAIVFLPACALSLLIAIALVRLAF